MGASKPGVEKVDVFDPQQQETSGLLQANVQPKIEEMLANLGYDLEGNPLYQQGATALGDNLSAFDPEEVGSVFDQTIGNPARTSFKENFIPNILERYVGRGGGRSSAAELLNTEGAAKLETNLASQKASSILTAKQQKEQIRQNAITQSLQFASAPQASQLSDTDRFLQYLNLATRPHNQIGVDQGSAGLLPSLISAAGTAGGAAIAASSRELKREIKDYNKGLSLIKKMDVKEYKYIFNDKKRIGLIAEDVPNDIQDQTANGILGVDLYGLIALSINAIKELSKKVEILEAK